MEKYLEKKLHLLNYTLTLYQVHPSFEGRKSKNASLDALRFLPFNAIHSTVVYCISAIFCSFSNLCLSNNKLLSSSTH